MPIRAIAPGAVAASRDCPAAASGARADQDAVVSAAGLAAFSGADR